MDQIRVKNYTLIIDNYNVDYNNVDSNKKTTGTVKITAAEKTKVGYYQTISNGTITIENINVTLVGLSFYRKIYEPGYIQAEIQITMSDGQAAPSFSKLKSAFLRKKVALTLTIQPVNKSYTLADNYYIHEISPRYEKSGKATSIYLTLSIYSMDNLMRLDKYSEAFLGRRLCSDILTLGAPDFTLNPDGKMTSPYTITTQVERLQYLAVTDDDGLQIEFMQPYLVQYNESFYDFLIRTANRCGEFLYFENGVLHTGLEQKKLDEYKKIENYTRLTFQSISEGAVTVTQHTHDSRKNSSWTEPSTKSTGTFNTTKWDKLSNPTAIDEPFTNSKVYNAEVTSDEFYMPLYMDQFSKGTVAEMFRDEKAGEQLTSFFTAAVSMTSLFDAIEAYGLKMATALIQAAQSKEKLNSAGNKTIKTYAPLKYDGTQEDTITAAVPYASAWLDKKNWITLEYYKDVKAKQEKQQRQMACAELGTEYQDLKLGDIVTFDSDTTRYVVIQIDMPSDQTMTIHAIPAIDSVENSNTVYNYYPPVLPQAPFRLSEPQHAIIYENSDPNQQGRVRIKYPWQLPQQPDPEKDDLSNTKFGLAKTNYETLKGTAKKDKNDALDAIKNISSDLKKKEDELEHLLAVKRALENNDITFLRKEYSLEDDETLSADQIKEKLKDLQGEDGKGGTIATKKNEIAEEKKKLSATQLKTISEQEGIITEKNLQIIQYDREIYFMTLNTYMADAASPWIRMVTPMATPGGGMFFKPEKGDEVLVNFEAGNVERPYVVGTLYNKHALAPNAGRIIKSPNGHVIKMDDPIDGVKFLGGMLPAIKFMSDYSWFGDSKLDATDGSFDRHLLGGITLTDAYGLYKISMSSHDRKIAISSPLGDVKIDAFTGITINAPNGNIKITGKNVDITANNRLTLTSGKNIRKGLLGTALVENGKTLGQKATVGAAEMLNDAVNQTLGSFIDLSFIRSLLEVVFRPVNGTLEIKSNSFLLLEAGGKSAQIPTTAYTSFYDNWHGRISKAVNRHYNRYKLLEKMAATISQADIAKKARKYQDLFNKTCSALAGLAVESFDVHGTLHKKSIFSEGHRFVSNKSSDDFVQLCFDHDKFTDVKSNLTWPHNYDLFYEGNVKKAFKAIYELRTYCDDFRNHIFKDYSSNKKLYTTLDSCVSKVFDDATIKTIAWVQEIDDIKDKAARVKQYSHYVTVAGETFTPNTDNTVKDANLTEEIKKFKRSLIYYLLVKPVGGGEAPINQCELFKQNSDGSQRITVTVDKDHGTSPAQVKLAAEVTQHALMAAKAAGNLDTTLDASHTKTAPVLDLTTDQIIKNENDQWAAFINTLTIADTTETHLFKDTLFTTAMTNFENRGIIFDDFDVWRADVKPQILMSEGSTTLSFDQTSGGTPEVVATPNPPIKKAADGSTTDVANYLKNLLIKVGL
ncbi:MAG: hypothetical protein J5545_01200 [Bacteroidaceae bacterium]|nr:hypothetical protein [Bacteroidaceae bacterium]